jgi:predicted Ser/Thr protein kinase
MSSHFFEAPSLELLAELLPAYDFESFIAQGGMGAVYKARQRSLDRDVAIKILPRELGADPDFRQSFATEARAMARLNHPNLIGVYDSGDVDGMPYIVMEFVNGKSLYHSAYNLAVEPDQAATIVKGICDGLAHAHENGVIHRDIKPANILLTPKTEPKIGDFGLAHAGEGPGVMMGTPGYTAPEVMSHPEHADRRSDIYSVGVILYELLTGHQPPLEGPIPPPSTICGCDAALDQICLKAMNVNALLRYQDAHEMSVALDSWLRRVASTPRLSPQEHRPQSVVPRGGPMVITTQSSGGGMAKNLVIAAIVVVVAAVGWQQYKKSSEEDQKQEEHAKQVAAERARADDEARAAKAKADDAEKAAKADPHANESPADSLERLKPLMVAGKRESMPKGSFIQHGAFTMLISTPMTWHQASAFAESYGGYLATTLADDDLQAFAKLLKEVPGATRIWTGAGKIGRDSWSTVDGSKWSAPKAPVGVGEFVAIDELGILRAMSDVEKQPFLIQWRADGSNPGTLEANLERTAASLSSSEPVFPPGTWSSGGRHVLAVYHSGPEAEAWQLAKSAGGHLAVTSGKDEGGWLVDQVAKLQGTAGFWIGAVRKGDAWNWMTRETWDTTFWADGFPKDDGTAIVIVPGKGWENVDPGAKPDGFIIEWSKDRESAPKSTGTEESATTPGDSGGGAAGNTPAVEITGAALDLRTRAKALIAKDEADRQKALAANAGTFKWDIDTWARTLSKTEGLRWKPDVEQLKGLVDGNHVPEKTPDGIRLSEEMSKIATRCKDKQAAINADFKTKAAIKRDAYIKNLEKSQAGASAEDAASFKSAIEEAKDLEGWLKALGAGGSDAAPSSSNVSKELDPIVGNWTFQYGIKVKIGADHSVFNGTDTGKWKLVSGGKPDRSYEFNWDNGNWDKLDMLADGSLKGTNNSSGESGGTKDGAKESKASSSSKSTGDIDPIVGNWMFQLEIPVKFGADHHASNPYNQGEWTLASGDGKTRKYEIKWGDGGWDKLDLGGEGRVLDGINSFFERDGKRSGGIKVDPDPAHPWAKDPIVGTWHYTGGEEFKLSATGSATSEKDAGGGWTLISGDDKKQVYKIWWKDNWEEMTLSVDGRHLDGKNLEKKPVHASRTGS